MKKDDYGELAIDIYTDDSKDHKPRRRYDPPVIETEETFERQAVLSCGKISGGVCVTRGGTRTS